MCIKFVQTHPSCGHPAEFETVEHVRLCIYALESDNLAPCGVWTYVDKPDHRLGPCEDCEAVRRMEEEVDAKVSAIMGPEDEEEKENAALDPDPDSAPERERGLYPATETDQEEDADLIEVSFPRVLPHSSDPANREELESAKAPLMDREDVTTSGPPLIDGVIGKSEEEPDEEAKVSPVEKDAQRRNAGPRSLHDELDALEDKEEDVEDDEYDVVG